jgi:hypothetical protein
MVRGNFYITEAKLKDTKYSVGEVVSTLLLYMYTLMNKTQQDIFHKVRSSSGWFISKEALSVVRTREICGNGKIVPNFRTRLKLGSQGTFFFTFNAEKSLES